MGIIAVAWVAAALVVWLNQKKVLLLFSLILIINTSAIHHQYTTGFKATPKKATPDLNRDIHSFPVFKTRPNIFTNLRRLCTSVCHVKIWH